MLISVIISCRSARGGYTDCGQELIGAASKVFGKSKKFVSAQVSRNSKEVNFLIICLTTTVFIP